MPEELSNLMQRALNRVCKWRSVLAGWQLGTRSLDDPESQAVRDQADARILLRIEVTALTSVLMEKGVIGLEELQRAIIAEAAELEKMYEQRFPGAKATDFGMSFDDRAKPWMSKFPK